MLTLAMEMRIRLALESVLPLGMKKEPAGQKDGLQDRQFIFSVGRSRRLTRQCHNAYKLGHRTSHVLAALSGKRMLDHSIVSA